MYFERLIMPIVKGFNLRSSDAEHDVLEHLILEKTKVLKGHHFLPKSKSKPPKPKPKKRLRAKKSNLNINRNFWFYLITLSIIAGELWYLSELLLSKYPNLFM